MARPSPAVHTAVVIKALDALVLSTVREAFSQEYAGIWTLRAMLRVTAQPTRSGTQGLLDAGAAEPASAE